MVMPLCIIKVSVALLMSVRIKYPEICMELFNTISPATFPKFYVEGKSKRRSQKLFGDEKV